MTARVTPVKSVIRGGIGTNVSTPFLPEGVAEIATDPEFSRVIAVGQA